MLKIRQTEYWKIDYEGGISEVDLKLPSEDFGEPLPVEGARFDSKEFAQSTAKLILEKFKAEHPVRVFDANGVRRRAIQGLLLSPADRQAACRELSCSGWQEAEVRYIAGDITLHEGGPGVALNFEIHARLVRTQNVTKTVSFEGEVYTRNCQEKFFSSWYPAHVEESQIVLAVYSCTENTVVDVP